VAEGLAARGQRLWEAYRLLVDGERGLVLLEEACRVADRLDRLDALLRGEQAEWFRLARDNADDLEVRVDSGLTEARQQQLVLRQLIVSLPLKGSDDDSDADAWLDSL